jgi:formate-dependent nitrite reductase cytochrome c552 subunit
MNELHKKTLVARIISGAFLVLGVAFLLDLWGHAPELTSVPPVDPAFLETDTVRVSYAELKRTDADLSDFDCYGCHEKDKPPVLKYDSEHNIIIPSEHGNIVMGHGRHNRNNNCYNCHDEQNLELFQTRDGLELSFQDSTVLCGSCHGPTYRDWEAGAHGRTSGAWDRNLEGFKRQDCVSCHDPHSPQFPGRKPAPGPNPLRP